jgi:HEAT repeat protein
MAKSRKLEETLTLLAQVRDEPASEQGLSILRQVLNSKFSVAIAQAAKRVGDAEITELIPELVTAFNRCLITPATTDPSCVAKKAIAEALYRMNYSDETVFLQGIRHIQMEAVWGGKEDTAPGLRAICALGLMRMNYDDGLNELADLLADPKEEARIGAARAIAYSENPAGVALLRLRVKIGDVPPVLSECLMALLQLAPDSSIPLVKDCLLARKPPLFLEAAVEVAEAAALALGESRLPSAFDLLRDWWPQVRDAELRQTGLLAIATLRQDQAIAFLLDLIADAPVTDAKAAIKALGIYQDDHRLWQQVMQTVEQRGSVELKRAIAAV